MTIDDYREKIMEMLEKVDSVSIMRKIYTFIKYLAY